MFRSIIILALVLTLFEALFAQSTGSIRGTVISQINDQPLAGVTVEITQLHRSVETNEQGVFEFARLAPGVYTLVTHFEGFSDQTRTVTVAAGGQPTVDFRLSIAALREEVTVTATGTEESVFEAFQTVDSVGAIRIREQASTSIGEILDREAGVGKRSFGPGTSRPVIRGFDGDRVLVLQDGVRNGSLASQSGDHGEPIDTLNLERLEVIKGPATLLYGSNAIGGVVNAVTSDEDNPHDGWRLNLSGVAATNQRQLGTSGGVEYGFRKFLFNLHANGIREGDYRTPLGRVPNSSSRAYGGSTTLGYFGDKGFIAGGLHFDRRRYGVPYAPLFEEGVLLTAPNGEPCDLDGPNADECGYDVEAIRDRFSRRLPPTPEEEIDLKMRQDNLRLRAGFRNVAGPVQQGNFFLNITRYRHQEIETEDGLDEVATNFFNTTTSYRAFFQQAKHGVLSGRFGFEGHHRDYLTAGAEQLINGNVRQNNFAVFGLQELDLGRVSLQFGGRVETNRYRPSDLSLYEPRQFTGFSAAASARIRLWEGASFVTNFTSAYRPPSLEELYNEGPHIGTVTFEIGNQDLRRERSTGVEFSLRQRLDKVRMNGSVFFYNIDSFIFIAPRDLDRDGNVDVEDNLPVGEFQQQDARFVGADLSLEWDVRNWLGAYVTADMVRAELRPSGTPLPRITPPRLRLGTDLRYRGLSVRPELLLVGAKGRGDIFTLETPTAGYALLNVAASYSIARDRTVHTFSVSTSNLTDRLYRNHLSYIKDLAPEPGRNLRFSYTLRLF